jgi:hypothetical protein
VEERVGMSGEIGESSGNIKTLLDVGDTVSLFWGVYGVERREGNSVSMVKFGLESEPEDTIGREVGEEWDRSETDMGVPGVEQREDRSVSGMQGRGVGDKQVSEEAWWRDGGNDVGWEVDLAGKEEVPIM